MSSQTETELARNSSKTTLKLYPAILNKEGYIDQGSATIQKELIQPTL